MMSLFPQVNIVWPLFYVSLERDFSSNLELGKKSIYDVSFRFFFHFQKRFGPSWFGRISFGRCILSQPEILPSMQISPKPDLKRLILRLIKIAVSTVFSNLPLLVCHNSYFLSCYVILQTHSFSRRDWRLTQRDRTATKGCRMFWEWKGGSEL